VNLGLLKEWLTIEASERRQVLLSIINMLHNKDKKVMVVVAD
jgi:hypothetical protein